ncbi:JNK, partial [Symbiodinium sp. CCMP2456]
VRIFLHHSSVPFSVTPASPTAAITEAEVKSVQAAWAGAIKSISQTYLDGGDYVAAATEAASALYGYGHTNVLFKPTKAAEKQFRPAADGSKTKVEYTFGYKRNADGKLRIFLHHSSVPYSLPPATSTAKISDEEVKSVQAAWANAIKSISKTYLTGGDYVAAAKAPFRPTGADAMSYFVGHKAVENGYVEDAGFAINGGKGWSDLVFENHKIDIAGDVAIAMGTYVFTNAAGWSHVVFRNRKNRSHDDVAIAVASYFFTSAAEEQGGACDDETRTSFRFDQLPQNADGKVRIFLSHSQRGNCHQAYFPSVAPSDLCTFVPLGLLTGWLYWPAGSSDFAGGIVVQIGSGVSGFVARAILGPRKHVSKDLDPANAPFVILGGCLLGLAGWDSSVALLCPPRWKAARAVAATFVAAAYSMLT